MILIVLPQHLENVGEESDQEIRCCYGYKTQGNIYDQVSHNVKK